MVTITSGDFYKLFQIFFGHPQCLWQVQLHPQGRGDVKLFPFQKPLIWSLMPSILTPLAIDVRADHFSHCLTVMMQPPLMARPTTTSMGSLSIAWTLKLKSPSCSWDWGDLIWVLDRQNWLINGGEWSSPLLQSWSLVFKQTNLEWSFPSNQLPLPHPGEATSINRDSQSSSNKVSILHHLEPFGLRNP